jgi:hypothetical protein
VLPARLRHSGGDKDKKGQTHRGYYWVYQNSIDKIVLFDYQEGRGREGPLIMLENFQGYLQTDGYSAYEIFDKRSGITLMHCMAHARRMFNEALDNDRERAEYALHEIQKLYEIERSCKEDQLSFTEIREVRLQESVPILESLGKWMKEQYMEVTPKSPIGKPLPTVLNAGKDYPFTQRMEYLISIIIRWRTASVLLLLAEKIICLPDHIACPAKAGKQRREVPCYTPCSAHVNYTK